MTMTTTTTEDHGLLLSRKFMIDRRGAFPGASSRATTGFFVITSTKISRDIPMNRLQALVSALSDSDTYDTDELGAK